MNKPIIALDIDGVVLDYNKSWPIPWKRAFGEDLVSKKVAFHAHNEYETGILSEEKFQEFKKHYTHESWATMPLLPGAKEACHMLADAGYTLVAVTSMPPEWETSRAMNLVDLHGLPFTNVIATGRPPGGGNPKLRYIEKLKPVAFVDDLVHNFYGIPEGVHCALLEPGFYDSPNHTGDKTQVDSIHDDLLTFTKYWLARQ